MHSSNWIIYWVPEIDMCPSSQGPRHSPFFSTKNHHIRMSTCLPKNNSFPASSAATSSHVIEVLKHGRVPLGRHFSPDEKMVPTRRWLWLCCLLAWSIDKTLESIFCGHNVKTFGWSWWRTRPRILHSQWSPETSHGPWTPYLDFLLRDREEREGGGASVIEATDNQFLSLTI